uniref:Polo kinase n=1 Tax=Strongyloides papillosus TaxID=174720 RepID=A0A0N5BJJ0_STREA
MGSNLPAEPPVEEQEDDEIVDEGIPILLKWRRYNKCICFLLFDGVLQVDFLKEHINVIISEPTSSISIIDKDNNLRTYCSEELAFTGMDEFMKKKITYIQKVVEEWTSLKRKHEADNDDVVPAKKCNIYK